MTTENATEVLAPREDAKGARRTSRAERGYLAIREAAYKVKTLTESELKRIVGAINPDAKESYLKVSVVEDGQWCDGYAHTEVLCSLWLGRLHRATQALVFFREMDRAGRSTQLFNELRLVLMFERSKEDSRRLSIDCETGLPWRSRAALQLREQCFTPEERKGAEEFDRQCEAKAREVLAEMRSEQRRRQGAKEGA